ncbi:uncharacterized protein LOC110629604 [Manihot esculenta]|uniref:Uncharacterized protein n=1 Tax=Manihot esculenta TaxID=3983 RepID=A0A2C9US41_MANES|nr:uncharacterized protein LOC110629604 [Manihot esculenta]OAY34064.1 hypothetical protein MANES_13G147000v8 [Manihot esculenta]
MIDFTSPPPSPLPLIIFSLLNFSFQETKQTIFFKFKIPHLSKSMKKSGFFAASVAAASATAISASPSSSTSSFSCNSNMHLSPEEASSNKDQQRTASTNKFAPRFDGLRFIETLVTAHR